MEEDEEVEDPFNSGLDELSLDQGASDVSGELRDGGTDFGAQSGARAEEVDREKGTSGGLASICSCCGVLSVESYQVYFNVETKDVAERLFAVAKVHEAGSFFEQIGETPDLYGPFWICATLIFLIAATSNLSSYFAHGSEQEPWQHDFKILGFAASFVYGFSIAMPLVAWGAFRYLGISNGLTFVQLACLYGYSISTFLVACILCTVPSQGFQWFAVLFALAWSAHFLVKNLKPDFSGSLAEQGGGYNPPGLEAQVQMLDADEPAGHNRQKKLVLLGGLLGVHLIFAVILKLYFFNKKAN